MSIQQLTEAFLALEEQGCHNINLVTPSHYVPQIAEALRRARLSVPVVYNTSSYECGETLRQLDGLVDIYLADLKYLDPQLAAKYSHAADYPETAKAAIEEMVRQTGGITYEHPDKTYVTGSRQFLMPILTLLRCVVLIVFLHKINTQLAVLINRLPELMNDLAAC